MPSFFIGANLPWLRYGGDFGASAWWPSGGVATREDGPALVDRLSALRASGVTVVRWFVFCDGRAGMAFGVDGMPVGPDAALFGDVERALDWLGRAGLLMLPVLFDFPWCHRRRVVNGVALGGRRHVLASLRPRRALLDRVVAPLLDRFGREPGIQAWDVINEPEWVTLGVGTANPFRSVRRSAMRDFIGGAAALVHDRTRHQVTVGTARARWLPLVEGLGLDFYQPHFYERFEPDLPLGTPVSTFGLDRPVVLGEFPTGGDARPTGLLLETARQAGYAGALFWSVMAGDEASDFPRAQASLDAWSRGAGSRHV